MPGRMALAKPKPQRVSTIGYAGSTRGFAPNPAGRRPDLPRGTFEKVPPLDPLQNFYTGGKGKGASANIEKAKQIYFLLLRKQICFLYFIKGRCTVCHIIPGRKTIFGAPLNNPPYKSFRGGLGEPFSKGSPIVFHRIPSYPIVSHRIPIVSPSLLPCRSSYIRTCTMRIWVSRYKRV